MPWLLKVQVPQNQCQVQLFSLHRYSTAHAASLSQPYMAALPCPLYIYHFEWPISWQLSEFWVPVWNFLLYMVKGARECCVWKRRSEFSQICGGKSANLKLPHKIKLSWINLQHSPLGDILNNVLFKAFLLCFFSRTCCSAAYSKLWPTDFLLPYPKSPLITLLDYSPLMSRAGLCFDELIAELLEGEILQE